MAIQTRIINELYTEIYVGEGNFITQSAPTNFHQFYTRKILTESESIDDFREVTAANTKAITLTLHPDAYARVTDEIFALAAEKNITIAST